MNNSIYDIRKRGIIGFLMVSVVVVVGFLYYSDSLVKDLSSQERARMQIWADATREIIGNSSSDGGDNSSMGFLLSIIEGNNSIPVLVTDDNGNIIMHRNFDLPEAIDSTAPMFISDVNRRYLEGKLDKLQGSTNIIDIDMGPFGHQHLYYEDSELLKSLSFYPYVQLVVLMAFVLIVYYAVSSTKRAEQNKIWVGLSKETAHQLGTPISSLMAWISILDEAGVDKEIVHEMDKDVNRLSMIASRFSKIGSTPSMEIENINDVAMSASEYMSCRISNKVQFDIDTCAEALNVRISSPLMSWVIENLIKNAVDAMDGNGTLSIKVYRDGADAGIDVTDTGKGIPKKNHRTVFNPGFTTKSRGWGLGLTLAKRIVEEYHNGEIFIKKSEVGQGSTFTVMLPLAEETETL